MAAWIFTYLNAANPYFYSLVFFSLYLSGIGFPISADLVLVSVGYLAYKGQADYRILIPLGISAIMATDATMFLIARRFGRKVLSVWPFRKIITTDRLNAAEKKYHQYGYRMIFLARFMPGIRTVFVFTGGLLKLDFFRFMLYDLLGGVIAISCTILSVKWVAGNIDGLLIQVAKIQWVILSTIGLVFFGFIFKRRLSKKKSV